MEKSGNCEKLPFGPINSPSPGPTLEIEVAAPEIEVVKSNPLKDKRAAIATISDLANQEAKDVSIQKEDYDEEENLEDFISN